MTTTTASELSVAPDVLAAFARELARACPGWSGAVLTVYGPDPWCPPWQFDLTSPSHPAPPPPPAS